MREVACTDTYLLIISTPYTFDYIIIEIAFILWQCACAQSYYPLQFS
jgi:hypothetical protein